MDSKGDWAGTVTMRIYGPRKDDEVVEKASPSSLQIEQAIDRLDNTADTGVILSFDEGSLSIAGGNKERVVIFFFGGQNARHKYGRLLDPKIPLDNTDEIDISIQGEINAEPLRWTVNKAQAKEVALYFALHRNVPKGLAWHGSMSET